MPKLKLTQMYPFVFAVFPIMSLAIYNQDQSPLQRALAPVLISLAGTVLVWGLIYLLSKSLSRSAILTSIFLILFFSFGQLLTAMRGLAYSMGVLSRAIPFIESTGALIFWFVLWVILFAVVAFLLSKTSLDLAQLDRFFSVFSVTLLILLLWNGVQIYLSGDKMDRFVQAWHQGLAQNPVAPSVSVAQVPNSVSSKVSAAQPPDIYYIILDGYGRGDIFKEYYNFDNSAFYSFLKSKGFYLADASHSNYMQTALSFASSLNYTYLDDIARQVGPQASSRIPLVAMATDNRVYQELRAHGYQVATYASGAPFSDLGDRGIYIAPPEDLNPFENTLIDTTPLPLFLKLPFLKTQYDFDRDRILFALDHLADSTRFPGPVFVFAHILAPHPPFVFGAQGETISPDRRFDYFDGSQFTSVASEDEYVQGYRDQVAFLTEKVEVTVDQILTQSAQPPIIIIQGDHGPGSMLDWASDKNSNIPERMSILNAYYFPDQDYQQLYPSISPVNTFRVVLNRLVGTNYPIVQDKSYFSTFANPYSFIDVSDRLNLGDSN